MKQNVIMQSSDRNLFGIIIRQQTKTGFLNVNDLQLSAEKVNNELGWREKRIDHILNYNENHERIYYLLGKQGYSITPTPAGFIEYIENQGGIISALKKIGAWQTTGARHTKTTWCDPYLFTLLAMELNPKLYAEVVCWLADKLIINRIEAGNFYKGLTKAVGKFNNVDYVKLAKALNYIVFGRHETGIRNTANQKELKELEELERKLAYAIDFDFLKTFDEVLEHLRKIWYQKQNNICN